MRKISYLSLAIMFVSLLSGYAQTMDPAKTTDYNNIKMPESPTSASLGKVDDLTVNTATGIPSINIPLYTFEMDGVSVPISISYNASGIKVGDLATSVGLNWSLEAGGQISRTVRGKADDFQGWFDPNFTYLSDAWFSSYDPDDPYMWQRNMVGHSSGFPSMAKEHDHNPDLFSYSFPGYSGSFIHMPDSNWTIIKEKNDGAKIIDWTEAEDLYGNTYYFGAATEKSNNKNYYGANGDYDSTDWEQSDGNIPVTSWKLNQITTKNGKEINFEYTDTNDFTYIIDPAENTITEGYSCSNNPSPIKSLSKTKIEYHFNTQLIDRISSPNGNIEITFTYGNDTGLPDGVWPFHLDEITIIDHTDATNQKKRGFRFVYERYNGDPRLRLDELYEVFYINDTQTVAKPHYKFSYEPGSLPEKDSKGQDFFGYNNNATGNNSLVPSITGLPTAFQAHFDANSGNRSLNTSYIDIGVLTGIEYPTGGKIEFEYQANSEDHPSNSIDIYLGGLRVHKIEKKEGSQTLSRQIYEYDGLQGFSMEHNRLFTIKAQGDDAHSYHSSFTAAPGCIAGYKTGYFYEKVTVRTIDPNSSISYKEEHIYQENINSVHKFDYALKEKKYYRDGSSLPIKIEEYTNGLCGNPTYFNWNILGDMMCFILNPNTLPTSFLGHNNNPIKVEYAGNYAFLPTRIATTDFLKEGSGTEPVTTVKYIVYDGETLLKTQEITDNQTTRTVDPGTGEVSYDLTDNKAEIITTDYQYPWSENIDLTGLPAALPISTIVHSNKHSGGEIFGQYFEYDTNGNIKSTYQYNKGGAGATNPPTYVNPDYEYMSSFLYSNGKPIQVTQKNGVPTSYIWAFNGQLPVAKIEGKSRQGINTTTLAGVENATYANLSSKLAVLRADPYLAGAMVTTYTYEPLKGVKTITDPKGDTVTFHYDALGRLEYVTDKNGKRLTENEYNYRPQ
jgi:YD repeat-containing protein